MAVTEHHCNWCGVRITDGGGADGRWYGIFDATGRRVDDAAVHEDCSAKFIAEHATRGWIRKGPVLAP